MNNRSTVFRARVSPVLLIALLVALFVPAAIGGQVGSLNSFTNGTTADANEVNANFDALKTAVDDNDTRITALEGAGSGAKQVIASQGLQPSASGSVWGVYGQSGSVGFAQILITQSGTLKGFSARPAATMNGGSSVTVQLVVNTVNVGAALTFTSADGTTTKADAGAGTAVSAGDLVTFRFSETLGVAPGTSLHASVNLE